MSRYKVIVDDNWHFEDEGQYTHDVFLTAEEAVAACKRIVDENLEHILKPGMTADELYEIYKLGGESPFILPINPTDEHIHFSASDYAREKAAKINRSPIKRGCSPASAAVMARVMARVAAQDMDPVLAKSAERLAAQARQLEPLINPRIDGKNAAESKPTKEATENASSSLGKTCSLSESVRFFFFLLIWMTCWFGLWIAGGLLFPNYETPAAIGAVIGFFGGALLAGWITHIGFNNGLRRTKGLASLTATDLNSMSSTAKGRLPTESEMADSWDDKIMAVLDKHKRPPSQELEKQ